MRSDKFFLKHALRKWMNEWSGCRVFHWPCVQMPSLTLLRSPTVKVECLPTISQHHSSAEITTNRWRRSCLTSTFSLATNQSVSPLYHFFSLFLCLSRCLSLCLSLSISLVISLSVSSSSSLPLFLCLSCSLSVCVSLCFNHHLLFAERIVSQQSEQVSFSFWCISCLLVFFQISIHEIYTMKELGIIMNL